MYFGSTSYPGDSWGHYEQPQNKSYMVSFSDSKKNNVWSITVYYLKIFALRVHILGVQTHTNACDQHWGGNERLKWVLINVAWLRLASWTSGILGWPRILIFHSWRILKQLLSVTFCDATAWIGASFSDTQPQTNGLTDEEVEIVN